jgi:hypothetical protein
MTPRRPGLPDSVYHWAMGFILGITLMAMLHGAG